MKRNTFPQTQHTTNQKPADDDSGRRTTLYNLMQQHSIQLSCPATINLTAIDDWLQSVLEIEIEPLGFPLAPAASPEQAAVTGLLARCLLLARVLLQTVNIPVFSPGAVLSVQQDTHDRSTWKAILAIVRIDHIDQRCYNLILKASINILLGLSEKPLTPENREALYTLLNKQVIHPLKKLVTAGKSTIPVLRVAHRLDIPFLHLGAGVYQLGWGNKGRRFDRSTVAMDSAMGGKLAQNKVWTAQLLRMAGLPAPEHGVVTTTEGAERIARRLGWPIVVKPADLDRGEGVTVGVNNNNSLLESFEKARKLSKSKRVIIERQVVGTCHRIFVANGQILYVVKRLPKSVKGDGSRTVAELIQAANQREKIRPPWQRTELFPNDEAAVDAMLTAGFTLDSAPGAGVAVPLRDIESTQWGGGDEDLTGSIHLENADIALRAAELFDLCVAGIDIISPDISRPWHENGAIINEVNFAPQLGRAETSRNYIPEFLSRFIKGDGRIPVEVYVGGESAVTAARSRQQELVKEGINCFITSHNLSMAPSGQKIHFPFESLFKRCRVFLLNSQVEAIILVVQTDEFMHTGLPVDSCNGLTVLPESLLTWSRPYEKLPQNRYDSLMAIFRSIFVAPGFPH
jgi:cyanophycin synthetase